MTKAFKETLPSHHGVSMRAKERRIALERAGLLDQMAEKIEKKDFVVLFGISVSDVIHQVATSMRKDAMVPQKKV